MNGTADGIIFEGGAVEREPVDVPDDWFLSTPETFDYWAGLADLTGPPAVTTLPDIDPEDGSTVEVRAPTSPRLDVTLVVVHGGKHRLPGQKQLPGSDTPINRDVDGVQVAWDFFTRQIGR